MKEQLAAEASRLDSCLTQAGLRVMGSTPLFRLAESPSAPILFERLGRAGILVRQFKDMPQRLRFGLPGDVQAWARLRAALAG